MQIFPPPPLRYRFGSAVLCCLLLCRVPEEPFRLLLPPGASLLVRGALLPVGTVLLKVAVARALRIRDDVSGENRICELGTTGRLYVLH